MVICIDNFSKADMEEFYKIWNDTQDIKTKIIDRLSKQLNVMQTTHRQQPDHILILNEHTTHNAYYEKIKRWMNMRISETYAYFYCFLLLLKIVKSWLKRIPIKIILFINNLRIHYRADSH